MADDRDETKIVGIDERGNRIGEDHPRAKLTDHEVELIRQLYEEHGLSLLAIAEKFEVSKSQVHNIVTYRDRATTPVGFRRVRVTPGTREIIEKHVGVRKTK